MNNFVLWIQDSFLNHIILWGAFCFILCLNSKIQTQSYKRRQSFRRASITITDFECYNVVINCYWIILISECVLVVIFILLCFVIFLRSCSMFFVLYLNYVCQLCYFCMICQKSSWNLLFYYPFLSFCNKYQGAKMCYRKRIMPHIVLCTW